MGSRKRIGNEQVPGTKAAVAYLRVSTDDQRNGIEAQRAALESWAHSQGVTITSWHTDEDVSGATEQGDRVGLTAALSDMRTSGVRVLLIAKRDRLARDTYVAAAIERTLASMGARVLCADGTGNSVGPEGMLLRGIMDVFAAYERDLIKSRTKAALAAKAARGERVGGIPYGYTLASDGVHLEPVQAEQSVIAEARLLRAQGLSLRKVSSALAARGHMHKAGHPFHAVQINTMCA